MKHIILDTNMLMAVSQFKLDVFTELENTCDFEFDVAIVDGTIKEIKKIRDVQRGKQRAAARLALQLIKKKKLKILKTSGRHVDDTLITFSKKGYIIATQDLALKRQLSKPYITIRKKKYLVII